MMNNTSRNLVSTGLDFSLLLDDGVEVIFTLYACKKCLALAMGNDANTDILFLPVPKSSADALQLVKDCMHAYMMDVYGDAGWVQVIPAM